MAKDFDREEYMEAHNEKAEDFVDRYPVTCPVGERDDCPFFKLEGGAANTDEMEWYCDHKDLAEGEDAESVGCPFEWEIEDEDE